MEPHHYPFKSNGPFEFTFSSIGPKGVIRKIVRYKFGSRQEFDLDLSFGDDTGEEDPNLYSTTDNGDTQLVLNTVAMTAIVMLRRYPKMNITTAGSSESRARLYQMAIAKHLNKIEKVVNIYGRRDGKWFRFTRDKEYSRFRATLKNKTNEDY